MDNKGKLLPDERALLYLRKQFPNLDIQCTFKYRKAFERRLNKLNTFIQGVNYIKYPLIVLPNGNVKIVYECGHSAIVREDHFLEGRKCTEYPCFSIRQSNTMKKYNIQHPDNSEKISKATKLGMQNIPDDIKRLQHIKGAETRKKLGYKQFGEILKLYLNDYSFRIKYIIKQSNKLRNKQSSLEKIFEDKLQDLNISYFSQAWLDFWEIAGTWFICDFYLWDYNLYINIDGFFHTDPSHMKRDKLLDLLCEKNNINIIHITDAELLNTNFDLRRLLSNYDKI